ncbi:hypothetical protein ARMSODRAFT_982204 [Armillaria solidipes]|uniref:DUF6533 domain-containing protein n=1 Tax=Armillaria solidipes TaxID=1076256 RepID=A0A2H3B7G8_9AGAR|nr:hypothetical protein ARMSODRAFT_982204 [Armillaria solidipes]
MATPLLERIDEILASLAQNAPYTGKTFLLWEYLINIDDEVDLFWFSKLSWIKCLFFVNRYLTIALRVWDILCSEFFVISDIEPGLSTVVIAHYGETTCGSVASYPLRYLCSLGLKSDSIVYVTIQILVMESILVLRVWAMLGRKKNVLVSFSILLFVNVAATLSMNLYLNDLSTISPLIMTLFNWLPMLIFELILFLTAAIYGVRGVKSTKILAEMRQNFGPKPIMNLLLRDSVFYFVIVLCCVPILILVDNKSGLSLMSVTITRMLLRLRKRAKADLNMPLSQDMELESFQVANPVEVSVASDA